MSSTSGPTPAPPSPGAETLPLLWDSPPSTSIGDDSTMFSRRNGRGSGYAEKANALPQRHNLANVGISMVIQDIMIHTIMTLTQIIGENLGIEEFPNLCGE